MHIVTEDIKINWTISETIEVIEGDDVEVTLTAQAFGFYANPIEIGVICKEPSVTGAAAGIYGHCFGL